MAAAVGGEVSLTYDAPGTVVDVGDVVVSWATGRRWLVIAARQQAAGVHAGRWHLRCVVLRPGSAAPADARWHELVWYPRVPRHRPGLPTA